MCRKNMACFLITALMLFVSCGGDDASALDACKSMECGPGGECAVLTGGDAICVCSPGYYEADGTCVEAVPGEECTGVTCSGHGQCVVIAGDPDYPVCLCDDGYNLVGTTSCVRAGTGAACGPGTYLENGQCVPEDQKPPDNYCVPAISDSSGPVELDQNASNHQTGALIWTGSKYLAMFVHNSASNRTLVTRTVTPDGTTGERLQIADQADTPALDISYGGLTGLAPCAGYVCGFMSDRGADPDTLSLVLEPSGELVERADLDNVAPVAILGNDQEAMLVYGDHFVPVDPQPLTLGASVTFGHGGRQILAATWDSDLGIVTADVDSSQGDGWEGWHDVSIHAWDETGSVRLGPIPVLATLTPDCTGVPYVVRTTSMSIVVFLYIMCDTSREAYVKVFERDGSERSAFHKVEGASSASPFEAADDFFFMALQRDFWIVFDPNGRPHSDALGNTVFHDSPFGDNEIGIPELTFKQGLAVEKNDAIGWIASWRNPDTYRAGVYFVRAVCE